MLLHDYLRRMSVMYKQYQIGVVALLSEITDPATRQKVQEWHPGDPITDLYPLVDEKTDKGESKAAEAPGLDKSSVVSETHLEDYGAAKAEGIPAPIAPEPVIPLTVPEPAAQAAGEAGNSEDNTNHTV